MKVLLGVALYPTEPAIFSATQASIDALQFDGDLAIDFFGGDDPALDRETNLTNKHNQMRERVLNLGYDALFLVEADMILPADALTKLAALDADVAYALYCSRHNGLWLCFEEIDGYRGKGLNANPERAKEVWGQVITSEGVGFGCTLIQRRVLERVEFHRQGRKNFADDWTFALDVKAAGFRSAHDLSVVCGHIVHEGGVMWPDPNEAKLHRVNDKPAAVEATPLPERAWYRALRLLSDGVRDYPIGEKIELGADAAAILLAAEAIEATESK